MNIMYLIIWIVCGILSFIINIFVVKKRHGSILLQDIFAMGLVGACLGPASLIFGIIALISNRKIIWNKKQ